MRHREDANLAIGRREHRATRHPIARKQRGERLDAVVAVGLFLEAALGRRERGVLAVIVERRHARRALVGIDVDRRLVHVPAQ